MLTLQYLLTEAPLDDEFREYLREQLAPQELILAQVDTSTLSPVKVRLLLVGETFFGLIERVGRPERVTYHSELYRVTWDSVISTRSTDPKQRPVVPADGPHTLGTNYLYLTSRQLEDTVHIEPLPASPARPQEPAGDRRRWVMGDLRSVNALVLPGR